MLESEAESAHDGELKDSAQQPLVIHGTDNPTLDEASPNSKRHIPPDAVLPTNAEGPQKGQLPGASGPCPPPVPASAKHLQARLRLLPVCTGHRRKNEGQCASPAPGISTQERRRRWGRCDGRLPGGEAQPGEDGSELHRWITGAV